MYIINIGSERYLVCFVKGFFIVGLGRPDPVAYAELEIFYRETFNYEEFVFR